jgi:hypothetical protein
LTAITKAGRLLWPLLLGETETKPPGGATIPPAAKPVPKPSSSPAAAPLPSVDDLFARIVAAYGGERNLRKHTRREIRARKIYENHGVEADVVYRASAPASRSEEETWTAAGKLIARVRFFFDGNRGAQETTFGQDATFAGDELERVRRKSAFHAVLEARKLFSQVAVDRSETQGGEDTFVLKLTPKSGPPLYQFVSARTSLILKEQTEGETIVFDDHRNVDGEILPFRTTIQDALGETTVVVRSISFDVDIPPDSFAPRKS